MNMTTALQNLPRQLEALQPALPLRIFGITVKLQPCKKLETNALLTPSHLRFGTPRDFSVHIFQFPMAQTMDRTWQDPPQTSQGISGIYSHHDCCIPGSNNASWEKDGCPNRIRKVHVWALFGEFNFVGVKGPKSLMGLMMVMVSLQMVMIHVVKFHQSKRPGKPIIWGKSEFVPVFHATVHLNSKSLVSGLQWFTRILEKDIPHPSSGSTSWMDFDAKWPKKPATWGWKPSWGCGAVRSFWLLANS